MKYLLPLSVLFLLFFTAPASVMAQHESHPYYRLGGMQELSFELSPKGNSLSYRFDSNPQWKEAQVFACFSDMPDGYSLRINNINLGKVEDGNIFAEFNITPFLRRDDNILELSFDSTAVPEPHASSLTMLRLRDAVHIRDVKITSYPIPGKTSSLVRIHLNLKSYQKRGKLDRTLALSISDSSDRQIYQERKALDFRLAFGQETDISFDCTLENPITWSPGQPDLYRVQLHLLQNGKYLGDLVESSFGVREAAYTDSLFIVNRDTILPVFADTLRFQSLCRMSDKQILSLFEEHGYNAIRADTLLPVRMMNFFDRHGILVLRDANGMQQPVFLQDFNRPSVIPGNECPSL